MDELLRDFLLETGEHADSVGAQLVQLERDPTDTAMIAAVFRLLHTIKGTSGFLGLERLGRLAHAAEALLSRLRDGAPATVETVALIIAAIDRIRFLLSEIERRQVEPDGVDDDLIDALSQETEAPVVPAPARHHPIDAPAFRSDARQDGKAATIRVSIDSLEAIVTLVSELVLTRNQLADVARRTGSAEVSATLDRLSSIVTDLQDQAMRARMQPLDRIFAGLPRLVRDLGHDLGKDLVLVVRGGETELDRQLLEIIRDPLTHLIRNCADHGLETRDERIAAGKPGAGMITVSAFHAGGQILIEVGDDGRGLNLARIGATALRRGIVDETTLSSMTVDDVARLVFSPGLSTASAVTAISGRGVGLDVVRANIEAVGGDVSVSSAAGLGTCFSIRIPLTLAIAPALIVKAGGHRFALPQPDIAEIVVTGGDSPHRCETVQGSEVLCLRGEVVPLLDLVAMLRLDRPARSGDERIVAVVRCGDAIFGLCVDAVEDVQEIVVKPIGALLAGLRLYAGHTILGDGSIVLILDPLGIAGAIGLRRGRPGHRQADLPAAKAATIRILTFKAGSRGIKALPLSFIKRIETVRTVEIERSAGRLVVRRDDGLLALLPLIEGAPLREPEQPVLIVEAAGHTFGLLVDEIVDIVEATLDIAVPGNGPEAAGASAINGSVTEFVDTGHVLRKADPYRRDIQTIDALEACAPQAVL